jgi:hydroxyquinol 1,2-dioxygenase
MQNLNEQTITDAVVERIADCPGPRLKKVMTALVRHLHEFAREVNLTQEEWHQGIEFLTAVGQICDDKRQEFILLSDTLGVSALVDILQNDGRPETVTDSSLLGPFYREGVPELPPGTDIGNTTSGERIALRGKVWSLDGQPIAGALLDIWQAAPNGLYDLQDDAQPEINLRGRFRTDAEGRYHFRSIKPASYPVPTDGPVGTMLKAIGRHPFRPAHIHFIVSAPKYETLTTALYIQGDKYLESDAVFGARKSLAVGYRPGDAKINGTVVRMDSIEFDFVLEPKRR